MVKGSFRQKRKFRSIFCFSFTVGIYRRIQDRNVTSLMEAVLKNLANAAELLAVAAHSDVVKRWDASTLSRAFHWARYCEQLYFKFHNNATMRRNMEEQLLHTNRSLQTVFSGHKDVCFSDLFRCQHLLLVGLLNNPELPISILKLLFDTRSPVIFSENEFDVAGLCSQIIQCKSACKVLSVFPDSSPCGADAEVLGLVLMQRLDAMLTQGSDVRPTEQFLDSVLQGYEKAAEHFYLVIVAALLTAAKSPTQTASQDFLLGWLQKKHRELQHMCSTLPTTLLRDLAKEHRKFRDAYYDILKRWASEMEYNIDEEEWIQTRTQSVTFQRLIEAFLALFEVNASFREDAVKELKALKISDGDFDVRGLSVWGDLLSALKRGTVS